ncbi:conserved hypothetical protein [Xenorhabdus szentirmaii DSM 16338]|uniref:DNA primase n=4 Tax=Xenorhabdus TaxID=626 RepID=W1IUT8_9GAMM|nr:conserved hypothetical protein [Xenorhabdus szentirmaii DSM 16338]
MLMLTTTAIDVDEELLNRCLVLTVNESREQTQAIHAMQRHRQTLEGLLADSEKGYLTKLHQNAQRLLRPLKVVNPYAHQLTFLSDKTRMRRDHMKYLTLIQAIALLHQYQREVKTANHRGQVIEYIEVIQDDIVLANQLAHEVLGRTLDEMPPQTRKLLLLIQDMVREQAQRQHCQPNEIRFTRRDIRAFTHWTDNQLKVHCLRLADMEYLLPHGGSRGHLLQYELLWDGTDNGSAHLCGLLDVNEATPKVAGNESKLDSGASKLVPSCPQVGAELESENSPPDQIQQGLKALQVGEVNHAVIKGKKKRRSLSPPDGDETSQADVAGDERKLDSETSKLVPSCPQVGAELDLEETASSQISQGLAVSQVGSRQKAVNSEKNKITSLPSALVAQSQTETEMNDGKP